MNNYAKYYNRPYWKKFVYLSFGWLALISKVVPKKRTRYVFGSMNGYAVSDNSKYLYLNIEENCEKYFITLNKDLLSRRLDNGAYPIYALSPHGIYLQITAKKAFYTHGIYDFIPSLIWGAEKHNLWHGVPIKDIGPHSDWKNNSKLKWILKRTFYRVFGYVYYMSCDYVYCSDSSRVEDYHCYFEVSKPSVIVLNQPRNKYAPKHTKKRKILYAPTLRKLHFTGFNFMEHIENIGLLSPQFIDFLDRLDATLVVRLHPVDKGELENKLPASIVLDETCDLYQSISCYTAIITDYSSIYYDCKELNVPCYIVAPDIVEYNQVVGMNNKLYKSIKTKKVDDVNQLQRALISALTSIN